MHRFIFVVAATVLAVEGKSLPSYIKPCRRNDPNLNECAKQHGQAAIPYIIKGDKSYKVPSLSPLHVPEIVIETNRDITVKLKDIYAKGFDTATIENIDIDLKNQRISGITSFKSQSVETQYEVDGRILVIPIKGKGKATITCDNLNITYSFDYNLVKEKDGKVYMKLLPPKVSYTVDNLHFNLENLFDGDKELGDRTNQFLNEHAAEIHKQFSSSVGEATSALVSTLIDRMAMVPYNEIFI